MNFMAIDEQDNYGVNTATINVKSDYKTNKKADTSNHSQQWNSRRDECTKCVVYLEVIVEEMIVRHAENEIFHAQPE